DWAKALPYLIKSGERAQHAYANQAALDFYARALEAAARVEPPVPLARLLEIHGHRSDVLVGITRYAEAIAEGERTVDLARRARPGRGALPRGRGRRSPASPSRTGQPCLRSTCPRSSA